jgi:mono/diheme cytochrome c family protein
MKNYKHLFILLSFAVLVAMSSCQGPDGNDTGSEYMPDMGHSIAYEANVYNYYYHNTWDSASVFKLKELSMPGEPIEGTIPRGYTGYVLAKSNQAKADVMDLMYGEAGPNSLRVPINGHVPFYYEDSEEERTRASAEIQDNPFPITEKGLATGKNLYDINCGICHGEKGDGNGWLVDETNTNAVYPAAPASFLTDEFLAASNGRYYYAVMYGKNVMGGYSDKLSYEERWQVIHHIRALQAKEKKLVYSADANTLNPAFGQPESQMEVIAHNDTPEEVEEETHEGEAHSDEDHGHDEGGH